MLASFFKFLCICATESLLGIYKPPELSQIIRSSTYLHLNSTSPRLVSTFTSTAPGWMTHAQSTTAVPVRLARVHQEDCSSSLARSRPLLKNVLTNAPSVSLQHFGCHHHLHRNILIAIIIYIATFWLPKSPDYSGRAIQVHTQECAMQAHGKTCSTSQFTADFVPFGTGLPLWHS